MFILIRWRLHRFFFIDTIRLIRHWIQAGVILFSLIRLERRV